MQPLAWSPISGCSHFSPGCANCKSVSLVGADLQDEFLRDGLVTQSKNGPVWSGELRLSEARLLQPLEWKEPAVWQVCAHGDLFHESAPGAWLDRVFRVMERCPWHGFQVLTKRAGRQCAYVRARYDGSPAPAHIAFGVSCERQHEADERIPLLIETPAATRFLTLYPVLGPLDLRRYFATGALRMVLAGQEPERPAKPEWFASLRDQCAAAGVDFINSSRLVGELEGV